MPGALRSLICTLLLAAAAPAQQVIQGDKNLIHRAPLPYPSAQAKGAGGTVIVEAVLNERGVVTDARVTSGPAVFRKTALHSVLDWHYEPGTPSPVEIVIEFRGYPALLNGQPAPSALPARAAAEAPKMQAGIIKRIQFTGPAAEFEELLRERLPIREGDSFHVDTVPLIADIVRQADEHLAVNYRMVNFDGLTREFELGIAYKVPVLP
jgi:TonB family protein